MSFGQLGTGHTGALWAMCWGRTYAMCAGCWQTTRTVAVALRPCLAIRDTRPTPGQAQER